MITLFFCQWNQNPERYSEPCQTSKMEHFPKIVNDQELLTIFAKLFVLDVQQDSEKIFGIFFRTFAFNTALKVSVFSRTRTEYGGILRISLCSVRKRKIWTRKTPNTNTFYAVQMTAWHVKTVTMFLVRLLLSEAVA